MPSVTWFRAGQPLTAAFPAERVYTEFSRQTGLSKVSITDAQKEDGGDFTVRATNKHGSFTFTVVVAIGKPPSGLKKGRKSSLLGSDEEGRKPIDTRVLKTDSEDIAKALAAKSQSKTVLKQSSEKDNLKSEQSHISVTEDVTVKSTDDLKVRLTDTADVLIDDVIVVGEGSGDIVSSKKTPGGYPPKLTAPSEPVYVDVGGYVVLTCNVQGGHLVTQCEIMSIASSH